MSTCSSATVERVWKVSPHEQRTVATWYSGWIPCFMGVVLLRRSGRSGPGLAPAPRTCAAQPRCDGGGGPDWSTVHRPSFIHRRGGGRLDPRVLADVGPLDVAQELLVGL